MCETNEVADFILGDVESEMLLCVDNRMRSCGVCVGAVRWWSLVVLRGRSWFAAMRWIVLTG